MTPDEEMDEWLAQEREGAGAHDPLCPFDPEGWEDCACEVIAKVRADEREKVYANLTEQGYVPVSMITDEREKIAQAIEADPLPEYEEVAYRDGFDAGQYRAARIARNGGLPNPTPSGKEASQDG